MEENFALKYQNVANKKRNDDHPKIPLGYLQVDSPPYSVSRNAWNSPQKFTETKIPSV